MSLFGALTEKPWLTPGLSDAARAMPDEGPHGWDKGVGVGVFLVIVTVLFSLVTSAYLMRMGLHGGALGHAGQDWHQFGEPPLLWINTFVLMGSSLAFVAALRAARAGRTAALRRYIVAGGLLGVAFLVGQIALWRLLNDWGYVMSYSIGVGQITGDPLSAPLDLTHSGNPAVAFFYLISGLHAVHIIGGLAAWALTARTVFSGAIPAATVRGIELCGRYWHFMLLVWLVMLGLFVST